MTFDTEELLKYAGKSSVDHINSHEVLEFIPSRYPIESYLEIGSGWGASMKHVLRHFRGKEIVCTDIQPWDLKGLKEQFYEDRAICELPRQACDYNLSHCYREFFELTTDLDAIDFQIHSLPSHELFKKLIDERRTFDLIYVDGDHSYGVSRADILYGLRCVKKDGLIVIDDINPGHLIHYGCSDSYFEIKKKYEDNPALTFTEFGMNFNIKTTTLPRELYSSGVGIICSSS